MHRRAVTVTALTIGLGLLTGCTGPDDDRAQGPSPGRTATPSTPAPATPAPTASGSASPTADTVDPAPTTTAAATPLVALDELAAERATFDQQCQAAQGDVAATPCVELAEHDLVIQRVVLDTYLEAWRARDAATMDTLAAPGAGADAGLVLPYTLTEGGLTCDRTTDADGPTCSVAVEEGAGGPEASGWELVLGVVRVEDRPTPWAVTAGQRDFG